MAVQVVARLVTGCALSLLTATWAAQAAPALPPDFQPPHAYIVEVENRIVASRAARARRQPASLAKLAAALVVSGRSAGSRVS